MEICAQLYALCRRAVAERGGVGVLKAAGVGSNSQIYGIAYLAGLIGAYFTYQLPDYSARCSLALIKQQVSGVLGVGGVVIYAQIDLAAIVLYGMGLDIPETWTAKIPANIFEELKEGTENKCTCAAIPDVSASEGFVLRTALTFDGKTVDTTSHTSPIVVGDPVYADGKVDLYQSQIIINPYK